MPKAKPTSRSVIEQLEEDHEQIRRAYRRFKKMDLEDAPSLRAVVHEVCDALEAHMELEEQVFYPAARKVLRDEELMEEAEIAHDYAKKLMRRLRRMKAGDAAYAPTFTVLCEYVLQHAKDEEDEIFPKALRRKLKIRAEEEG